MSSYYFMFILQFITVCTTLKQVRTVLNKAGKSFQERFIPGRHISIDKCMMNFTGRLSFFYNKCY